MKKIENIFFIKKIRIRKIKILACFSIFEYYLFSVTYFCEINNSKFPSTNSKLKLYKNSQLLKQIISEFLSLPYNFFTTQEDAEKHLKSRFNSEFKQQNDFLFEKEKNCNIPEIEFLKLIIIDLDRLLFDENNYYIGEKTAPFIKKALDETIELSTTSFFLVPKSSIYLYSTFSKKFTQKMKKN